MIVWRALQGFIGGGMIPTVFASAFTIFPRSKQPIIAPIIGLVATLAPTIGPTVGGYLTDWFSWHWLFLVNLGPGIIVTAAAWLLIDFDKPDWSLLTHFDYFGLIAMAGFLGAAEYALEEGPSKDWFESGPVTIADRRLGRRAASSSSGAPSPPSSRSSISPPFATAISGPARPSPSCSASGSTA